MGSGRFRRFKRGSLAGSVLLVLAIEILQKPGWAERDRARPVSVAELTRIVRQVRGKHDAQAAKEIYRLRLTERLSSPKLAMLRARLPGTQSKTALTAVGDTAVFLKPPLDEIPKETVPDLADQRRMIALAVDYLKRVIPKLPDFYANRWTTSFDQTSTPKQEERKESFWEPAGEFRATVEYRRARKLSTPRGPRQSSS